MKSYMEKMKKISGSGQCALVLAIIERIMKYEELKIESEVYNFVEKTVEVYWYWLNGEIILDYDDVYCIVGIENDGVDFCTYYYGIIRKNYPNSDICNKYSLLYSLFAVLALHVQGKEVEYYNLDTEVYEIGDIYIEEAIEKTLEQKIISEDEFYFLLDYLNEKYPAYCDIDKNDVIDAVKNKNKMFIEKGYEKRNPRRINASGQCALALMIAEKVLHNEKLDRTDNIYQFAQERIAYCWKWLNGEIKGKEDIEKVIYTDDEDKNIQLSCCWNQKDEINQLYAFICRAISIVKIKSLLSFDEFIDEFNEIDIILTNIMNYSIKLNVVTQQEYNNWVDYLDNQYYNYPNISKSEMMALLEKSGK